MLRDATQAALLELLQTNGIRFEHNKAENTLLLNDTGSKILFRPVDEFERLRGTNLAWFGLDELTYTQEESWLRLQGRLRDPKARRLCGFAVWTPKGHDWVYRKFISDAAPSYEAIIAKPFENRHLLSKVPDFYARLCESYDPTFYEQEVMGAYLSLDGGRVYSSFNRAENVRELAVAEHLPLLWTLDFNVDPMSSLIVQVLGGRIHVLDEIVIRHGTTVEACAEFLRRYPAHPSGVTVFGDASGYKAQTTGSSDYAVIKDYFRVNASTRVNYTVPRSNPSVRERINLMNSKLRAADGTLSLLVDPKCKELIRDFDQVCYKADSNQIDKDRDRMRTHMSDALGYLVWQECRPMPKIGEKRERLL